MVGKIDALFTLTEKNIPFSRFDRTNPEVVTAFYNLYTIIFHSRNSY